MKGIAVSLSGSGHLLVYHLGALQTLLEAPAWAPLIQTFAGTSGGAMAAAAARLLPRERLGGFAEAAFSGDAFGQLARELSPGGAIAADAPRAASGSLLIGATECESGRASLFGRYASAEELLTCVLASAAIPRSAHPFDLARARPRYPYREGVLAPIACEWDGGIAAAASGAPAGLSGAPRDEWACVRAYVDGGLTAALPPLPAKLGLRTLTVSPIAGPRGRAQAVGAYHLCPRDSSFRLPITPALGGMRCFLSLHNLRAAQAAAGAPARVLRGWFERGRADAAELVAELSPSEAFDVGAAGAHSE
jgi:predicted acylesterase/phospholipase RssA